MDVAKQPGLMARGRRWYLRAKVPTDLVDFLGRQEVWRSLRTGDHAVAVKRHRRARADLDVWLDAQRRRRDAGERLAGELPRLVSSWFHSEDRKAAGRYKGRAPTARAKLDQIQALKAEGNGASEIARRLGIGRASVYRLLGSAV